MLAAAALLGLLSFWQTPEEACVAQGGEFVYPALARAARIQGAVVVGVAIGEDGTPLIETIQGHPLLSPALDEQISSVRFPSACVGQEIDLRLVYRLSESDEANGSRATGPNEWLIKGLAFHTVDMPAVVGRKPWWKRIFHR